MVVGVCVVCALWLLECVWCGCRCVGCLFACVFSSVCMFRCMWCVDWWIVVLLRVVCVELCFAVLCFM